MFTNISIFNTIFNDAPQPWQIGFQDSAAPGFTGIVELHNTLFFYLVVICVGVFWVLGSVIYYYNSEKSPIVHKYLNHGTLKCLHANKFIDCMAKGHNISLRNYSSKAQSMEEVKSIKVDSETETGNIKPVKYYSDAYAMKLLILKENKNKSGIYRFTNKLNGNFYIGSSINLSNRFTRYFNIAYISKVKNNLTISRALIKYGYSNFTLEILEYCEIPLLLDREQYYLDLLKPTYNIAKIAGSTLGVLKSKEMKEKISKTLKDVYAGENSSLFGKAHTDETKLLMSQAQLGVKNAMFGKTHTDETKILMSLTRKGKVHNSKTRKAISIANGTALYLYAACISNSTPLGPDAFCLIKEFSSIREAGKYLNVSHSTVSKYLKSGKLLSRGPKGKGIFYKCSSTLL